MSQCTGYFTNFVARDGKSCGKSRQVSIAVSHPSRDWCQFTIIDGKRSARLSIPMGQFFELVEKMDDLLQAQSSA